MKIDFDLYLISKSICCLLNDLKIDFDFHLSFKINLLFVGWFKIDIDYILISKSIYVYLNLENQLGKLKQFISIYNKL